MPHSEVPHGGCDVIVTQVRKGLPRRDKNVASYGHSFSFPIPFLSVYFFASFLFLGGFSSAFVLFLKLLIVEIGLSEGAGNFGISSQVKYRQIKSHDDTKRKRKRERKKSKAIFRDITKERKKVEGEIKEGKEERQRELNGENDREDGEKYRR